MPKVVLEFEVTDKGLAQVPRLLSETEAGLRRLGKASGDSASGLAQHAGASDRAGLSMQTLRRGINDVALAFGQSSPQVTNMALGLGHVVERMSGVSTSAKILGGSIIAAGGTVAYLFAQFKESERIAQRFGAIDQAVRSLDLGRISSALQEVNLEFATFGRQGEFWIGRVAAAADRARRTLFGLPSAFQEASAAEERLRGGLEGATSLQRGNEAAGFRQEMAGLNVQARQKSLQSQLAQGLANPLAIELSRGFTRLDIQGAYEAAVEELDFELQKAIQASGGRGTLDIGRPAIEARYREQIAKLQAQKAIQDFDIDEQARQQTEAVRGQREQTRATGAGLGIEQQQAHVRALEAGQAAARKMQAENEAFQKRIGVPAFLLPGVDPRAVQLIQEQTKAVIMGIDETLAKNLAAINQLKASEEDKARLIAQATDTANISRRTANEEALRETNELYDSAAKLRFELVQQGQAVQSGLVAGLDAAKNKAEELAASMKETAAGGREASGQARPGISWEEWRMQWHVTPMGGGSGLDLSPPKIPPIGWKGPMTIDEAARGGETFTFQHGGFVPGPRGAPQMVGAHGGEAILNERELAFIRALIPYATQSDRPLTVAVDLHIAGENIGRVIAPSLQKEIASGRLRLGK